MIATDWGERIALDPNVMPGATPDWLAHVMAHGLAHADASGFVAIGLEVDCADDVLRDVLVGLGFEIEDDGSVETWLVADARPDVSLLHDDYRLSNRLEGAAAHGSIELGRPVELSELMNPAFTTADGMWPFFAETLAAE